MTIADLETALRFWESKTEEDQDVSAVYFELPNDGISLIVKNGLLKTIFIHIDSAESGQVAFSGSTDLIEASFFQNPSHEAFEHILKRAGFFKLEQQYPFATDMLTENTRLRYEDRPGKRMIVLDDGSMVRTA